MILTTEGTNFLSDLKNSDNILKIGKFSIGKSGNINEIKNDLLSVWINESKILKLSIDLTQINFEDTDGLEIFCYYNNKYNNTSIGENYELAFTLVPEENEVFSKSINLIDINLSSISENILARIDSVLPNELSILEKFNLDIGSSIFLISDIDEKNLITKDSFEKKLYSTKRIDTENCFNYGKSIINNNGERIIKKYIHREYNENQFFPELINSDSIKSIEDNILCYTVGNNSTKFKLSGLVGYTDFVIENNKIINKISGFQKIHEIPNIKVTKTYTDKLNEYIWKEDSSIKLDNKLNFIVPENLENYQKKDYLTIQAQFLNYNNSYIKLLKNIKIIQKSYPIQENTNAWDIEYNMEDNIKIDYEYYPETNLSPTPVIIFLDKDKDKRKNPDNYYIEYYGELKTNIKFNLKTPINSNNIELSYEYLPGYEDTTKTAEEVFNEFFKVDIISEQENLLMLEVTSLGIENYDHTTYTDNWFPHIITEINDIDNDGIPYKKKLGKSVVIKLKVTAKLDNFFDLDSYSSEFIILRQPKISLFGYLDYNEEFILSEKDDRGYLYGTSLLQIRNSANVTNSTTANYVQYFNSKINVWIKDNFQTNIPNIEDNNILKNNFGRLIIGTGTGTSLYGIGYDELQVYINENKLNDFLINNLAESTNHIGTITFNALSNHYFQDNKSSVSEIVNSLGESISSWKNEIFMPTIDIPITYQNDIKPTAKYSKNSEEESMELIDNNYHTSVDDVRYYTEIDLKTISPFMIKVNSSLIIYINGERIKEPYLKYYSGNTKIHVIRPYGDWNHGRAGAGSSPSFTVLVNGNEYNFIIDWNGSSSFPNINNDDFRIVDNKENYCFRLSNNLKDTSYFNLIALRGKKILVNSDSDVYIAGQTDRDTKGTYNDDEVVGRSKYFPPSTFPIHIDVKGNIINEIITDHPLADNITYPLGTFDENNNPIEIDEETDNYSKSINRFYKLFEPKYKDFIDITSQDFKNKGDSYYNWHEISILERKNEDGVIGVEKYNKVNSRVPSYKFPLSTYISEVPKDNIYETSFCNSSYIDYSLPDYSTSNDHNTKLTLKYGTSIITLDSFGNMIMPNLYDKLGYKDTDTINILVSSVPENYKQNKELEELLYSSIYTQSPYPIDDNYSCAFGDNQWTAENNFNLRNNTELLNVIDYDSMIEIGDCDSYLKYNKRSFNDICNFTKEDYNILSGIKLNLKNITKDFQVIAINKLNSHNIFSNFNINPYYSIADSPDGTSNFENEANKLIPPVETNLNIEYLNDYKKGEYLKIGDKKYIYNLMNEEDVIRLDTIYQKDYTNGSLDLILYKWYQSDIITISQDINSPNTLISNDLYIDGSIYYHNGNKIYETYSSDKNIKPSQGIDAFNKGGGLLSGVSRIPINTKIINNYYSNIIKEETPIPFDNELLSIDNLQKSITATFNITIDLENKFIVDDDGNTLKYSHNINIPWVGIENTLSVFEKNEEGIFNINFIMFNDNIDYIIEKECNWDDTEINITILPTHSDDLINYKLGTYILTKDLSYYSDITVLSENKCNVFFNSEVLDYQDDLNGYEIKNDYIKIKFNQNDTTETIIRKVIIQSNNKKVEIRINQGGCVNNIYLLDYKDNIIDDENKKLLLHSSGICLNYINNISIFKIRSRSNTIYNYINNTVNLKYSVGSLKDIGESIELPNLSSIEEKDINGEKYYEITIKATFPPNFIEQQREGYVYFLSNNDLTCIYTIPFVQGYLCPIVKDTLTNKLYLLEEKNGEYICNIGTKYNPVEYDLVNIDKYNYSILFKQCELSVIYDSTDSRNPFKFTDTISNNPVIITSGKKINHINDEKYATIQYYSEPWKLLGNTKYIIDSDYNTDLFYSYRNDSSEDYPILHHYFKKLNTDINITENDLIEITVRLSLSNYKLTENNSVNFSNNSIISEVNSLTFSPIKYVFYLKYK